MDLRTQWIVDTGKVYSRDTIKELSDLVWDVLSVDSIGHTLRRLIYNYLMYNHFEDMIVDGKPDEDAVAGNVCMILRRMNNELF